MTHHLQTSVSLKPLRFCLSLSQPKSSKVWERSPIPCFVRHFNSCILCIVLSTCLWQGLRNLLLNLVSVSLNKSLTSASYPPQHWIAPQTATMSPVQTPARRLVLEHRPPVVDPAQRPVCVIPAMSSVPANVWRGLPVAAAIPTASTTRYRELERQEKWCLLIFNIYYLRVMTFTSGFHGDGDWTLILIQILLVYVSNTCCSVQHWLEFTSIIQRLNNSFVFLVSLSITCVCFSLERSFMWRTVSWSAGVTLPSSPVQPPNAPPCTSVKSRMETWAAIPLVRSGPLEHKDVKFNLKSWFYKHDLHSTVRL